MKKLISLIALSAAMLSVSNQTYAGSGSGAIVICTETSGNFVQCKSSAGSWQDSVFKLETGNWKLISVIYDPRIKKRVYFFAARSY